jgi:hypothetical protein
LQAFKEKINPKVVVGFWKSVLIRAQEYIESDDNVVFWMRKWVMMTILMLMMNCKKIFLN